MNKNKKYSHDRPMLDFFMEIWNERDHVSQISNTPIREFSVQCFAHLLNRNSYPELKYNKENVVLMQPQEHHVFDFQTDIAKKDPRFAWAFAKRDELKFKSHNSHNNKTIRA